MGFVKHGRRMWVWDGTGVLARLSCGVGRDAGGDVAGDGKGRVRKDAAVVLK